jgi:hypothetical protein
MRRITIKFKYPANNNQIQNSFSYGSGTQVSFFDEKKFRGKKSRAALSVRATKAIKKNNMYK